MRKKILSLFAVALVVINLCIPVCAYGIDQAQAEALLERTIQSEIAREEERIFASVYAQLELQDAVNMMDIYKEILTPRIEMNVRLKHGALLPQSINSHSVTFNNGGTLGYHSGLNATVLDTFMTDKQYDTFVWGVVAENIILGEAEYYLRDFYDFMGVTFAGWGLPFAMLAVAQSIATVSAIHDVESADCFAETINVTLDGGVESSSVLLGWSQHPLATTSASAEDVHVVYY